MWSTLSTSGVGESNDGAEMGGWSLRPTVLVGVAAVMAVVARAAAWHGAGPVSRLGPAMSALDAWPKLPHLRAQRCPLQCGVLQLRGGRAEDTPAAKKRKRERPGRTGSAGQEGGGVDDAGAAAHGKRADQDPDSDTDAHTRTRQRPSWLPPPLPSEMQAFQSDGGRGTTKGLSTAAGHPGSARAGIRDAQIDLGNLCVLLPGADVGPWPTDTESPVYADLIHDTAREAVGELFRRLQEQRIESARADGAVEVAMPAARELVPKVWREKQIRQTPWERFAQSKGIGKHRRDRGDGESRGAPSTSRPRKLRGRLARDSTGPAIQEIDERGKPIHSKSKTAHRKRAGEKGLGAGFAGGAGGTRRRGMQSGGAGGFVSRVAPTKKVRRAEPKKKVARQAKRRSKGGR